MRVAIVCPYALDVPGGVQGQSIGLAEALARRGHVVTLLAPGAKGLLREGVSVLPLGATRGVPANGSRAPIALSPTVIPRLARALSTGDFEVVHLEEPFVPLCSLASLLLARAPLIGTFHRAGAGRVYRAMRPVLRRAALHLSARVAVSGAANATLSAVSGTEAEMILNNAIDLARFSPRMSLPGRRRIAFVGRHERRKGLAVLLEAFTRALRRARAARRRERPRERRAARRVSRPPRPLARASGRRGRRQDPRRGRDLLRPRPRRRVLRGRPPRGDGGRLCRGRLRSRRLS